MILKQAEALYRKRQFSKLISILEPQVFRFRDNYRFYYLLGTACFATGDYGGAHSYLERALQLSPENEDILIKLAVIHLKKTEQQKALDSLLLILEVNPSNKKANRLLSMVQIANRKGRTRRLQEQHSIVSLALDPKPISLPKLLLLSTVFLILTAVIIQFDIPGIYRRWINPVPRELSIPSLKELETVEPGEYSEEEIASLYNRMKQSFDDFNDNETRYYINILLNSNASKTIKETASSIIRYLKEPSMATLETTYSYETVLANPEFYDGVYVKWKGRVANILIADNKVQANLLVGYESGEIIRGSVSLYYSFNRRIEIDTPYEFLGQLELDDQNSLRLRVITFRELAL
jgi:hypothetical protein